MASQIEEVEQLLDPHLKRGPTHCVEAAEHAEILARRQRLDHDVVLQRHAESAPNGAGLASDVHAEHPDRTGIRPGDAVDHTQRRRLARAIGPEKPKALALRHVEIKIGQDEDSDGNIDWYRWEDWANANSSGEFGVSLASAGTYQIEARPGWGTTGYASSSYTVVTTSADSTISVASVTDPYGQAVTAESDGSYVLGLATPNFSGIVVKSDASAAFDAHIDVMQQVDSNSDGQWDYYEWVNSDHAKPVTVGDVTIELRKSGTGPLYYNAYVSYFTLEDYITKAGLEVRVNRQYYRLNRVEKAVAVAGSRGQAVDQQAEKYEREPLADLSTLKSGDLVEIELVIESKNDYEYLVFEDMKPAGFEPVDLRSGYTDNAMRAYVEFRDERVAFFVNRLARGTHSVVVSTALFTRDDELAGEVVAVWQLFDSTEVVAAEDGGGAQGQGCRRAGGDQARLGSGQLGDPLPGGRLQLLQRHPLGSSVAKGIEHLGGHGSTTETGDCARGVDDRGQAEILVAGHGCLEPGLRVASS